MIFRAKIVDTHVKKINKELEKIERVKTVF